ncbi:MAG: hypothetical protein AB1346_12280 [Thermodesulfobacteriota bacterium]
MDAPSYKLHIKIGNAEFDAEGPQEVVQKSFDKFLDAAGRVASAQVAPPSLEEPAVAPPPKPPGSRQLDTALLPRVFDADPKRQIVSLRILPPGGPNRAGDAGIMILYGAQMMLRIHDFPVTKLKKGLVKSGVQFDRVDKLIAPCTQFVIKSGSKGVGGKYALNNLGIAHAESLVQSLFG